MRTRLPASLKIASSLPVHGTLRRIQILFGRYIEISPYTLEQIRYWMRQNFNFGKDVPILIKEVPCVKDKCPPIETAIMAMQPNAPPRAFKVQKPINEITFDHIYDLIENPMPCC